MIIVIFFNILYSLIPVDSNYWKLRVKMDVSDKHKSTVFLWNYLTDLLEVDLELVLEATADGM